jgi:outer membrane lipoprotein-sorting protein
MVVCSGLSADNSSVTKCITSDELKARIENQTKDFKDIVMTVTITGKNKEALESIEPSYTRMYEFKSASVSFKAPDKVRTEGKLGMVRFEYIINGYTKIVRSPTIRLNQKSDYKNDPGKIQDAFDLGLICSAIYKNRRIETLEDPQAQLNGEIKVRLFYPNSDMQYMAWLDERNLWLKRFEKRTSKGILKVRYEFSEPKYIDNIIWIPTRTEMYAPSGDKAGISETSNIKVNVGLDDKIFE